MTMKDAYEKKLEAKLHEWDAEIDRLAAKAEQAGASARIEYHKEIEYLREQQKNAHAKLDELRQSSDSAWEDLKAGIAGAWDRLDDSLKKARSRFEGK